MVLVFSRGAWVDITVPNNPSWSPDTYFLYATVLASFVAKGFSHEKSSQLAEAYVFKKTLGLSYSKSIEAELALVGTA
jgi:hypothetical protein